MPDHARERVVTRKTVAESIDWLGGRYSDDEAVDFDSADWTDVAETGVVVLEGTFRGGHVSAAVRIESVTYSERDEFDVDYWDEDGDDA